MIEKGFNPQPVARAKKLAFFLVPYRERKHPIELFYASFSPLYICRKKHLSVRVRFKIIISIELFFYFKIVVNLSVKYKNETPVIRKKGLMPCGRQVNNGKTPEPEGGFFFPLVIYP